MFIEVVSIKVCQKYNQTGKMNHTKIGINGILLPKLFWHTVRNNCSSDREKPLKFEAEGREFATFFRSLEQFIQTVNVKS